MKLIGICRLGRDAETRYTPSGEAVCGFSAAFDYGRKEGDRRPTQWVEFTLWGKRAEALSEHLLKGTQLFIVAGDVHVETYEKRDGGSGVKLVAKVEDLQFAGSRGDREGGEQRQAAPAPAPRAAAPAPRPAAKPSSGGTGFDDMDDDIPF
jgi:single-strand DNA-binding protein